MSYLSYPFVLFTALVVMLYYIIPKSGQWRLLLAASLVFYCSFGPIYIVCPLAAALVTWSGARLFFIKRGGVRRRSATGLLILLLLMNLGTLFAVKWAGMETALINRIFHTNLALRVFLPLGVSFFTFQNAAYLIDVYRGDIPAEENFWHYLLYTVYFPGIVSGPINRYAQMRQQFFNAHTFRKDVFYGAFLRILYGLFKKMVLADRAAVFVNEVFDHYYMYRGLFVLFAVVLFSIQLYMDFSGCMDIVIGVSELFGIRMRENFNAPYGAESVADFWRRWHISLTSWFRDYLYIPLGGNRRGKYRKYLHILIVFLFCGAWHGAGFTWLAWGGLNGLYQIAGDMTRSARQRVCSFLGLEEKSGGAVLRKRLTTIVLIEFGWLFFRANGIREAFIMLRRMVSGWNPWILSDGSLYEAGLDPWDFLILITGTIIVGILSQLGQKQNLHDIFVKQSWLFQAVVILLTAVTCYLFGIYGPQIDAADFIYYNF